MSKSKIKGRRVKIPEFKIVSSPIIQMDKVMRMPFSFNYPKAVHWIDEVKSIINNKGRTPMEQIMYEEDLRIFAELDRMDEND